MSCQGMYQQCGGSSWDGARCCAPPLRCLAENEYYAQCLDVCPRGWACTQHDVHGMASSEHGRSGHGDEVESCRFAFGTAFMGSSHYYGDVDHLSVWLGQSDASGGMFNDDWHGAALRKAMQLGATPVFYAYVIAFLARRLAGLQDCDVGQPPLTLCARGASFVRQHRQLITRSALGVPVY